jgi:hypothetical protein
VTLLVARISPVTAEPGVPIPKELNCVFVPVAKSVGPEADTYAARLDGYVQNTFFVPAERVTTEPELLEAKIVSRERVVPEAVYVPSPTSHSDEVELEIA